MQEYQACIKEDIIFIHKVMEGTGLPNGRLQKPIEYERSSAFMHKYEDVSVEIHEDYS